MTTRTELLNLYKASQAAHAKFDRNKAKLDWMALQSNAVDFHHFNMKGDLDRYFADAKAASAEFRAALAPMGWNTDQIVEFIEEVGR